MFGLSETRQDQISQIQRGMRTLDRLLSRFSETAVQDARDTADRGRDSAAEAFGDVAERFRSGAELVGSEAMRFGRRATALGEMSADRFAKNVGIHPLMVVGIAIGLGAIVGAARYRHSVANPPPRKRPARVRKGNGK
jgi:hypothetical protein